MIARTVVHLAYIALFVSSVFVIANALPVEWLRKRIEDRHDR